MKIAFLGGSITQAPGYRVQFEKWFKRSYPEVPLSTINAGIGGTGSDLGVARVDEKVLSENPDLVFVEFAVNDAQTVLCKSYVQWKVLSGKSRNIRSR